MKKTSISPDFIREQIATIKYWHHQIELAPGIITPGVSDTYEMLKILDGLNLPKNCSGLRVLDIGCRDGFFAFEMEKRGAEVIGIDYALPSVTGFEVASKILNSEVTYIVENVYDLAPNSYGLFDVVLFLGVLYHLRNPLFALDRIRTITKPRGMIFVESLLAIDKSLSEISTPAFQFFPKDSLYHDATSKWAPNMDGLKAIVEEACFSVDDSLTYGDRGCVKAVAVNDDDCLSVRDLDSSKGEAIG